MTMRNVLFLSAYYVDFIFGSVLVVCLGNKYFINADNQKKQHTEIYIHPLYTGTFLWIGS